MTDMLCRTTLNNRAVWFFDSRFFDLSGKTWEIVGLEFVRKGRDLIDTLYHIKSDGYHHTVSESKIIERHEQQLIAVKQVTMSELKVNRP